jgi:hypothetical protein
MQRWFGVMAVLAALTWASPAQALPKCWGPYTLNSDNYAPDTTGEYIFDWIGDFTVQLAIASGTMTVTSEARLPGMASFVALGQQTTSSAPQFHGPFERVRFLVTSCSSCLATLTVCGNTE